MGVGAQWLAWQLHLPSILLLLIAGFVAGPVTGLIDPDALLGDRLFPLVELSVAIILFEGGLSLRVRELNEIGGVVRRLITTGILITWSATTVLAIVLLDLEVPLALLLGALFVVSGPTVIIPLLQQIRPEGRVGDAIKWEGIVNDPIGAILAVLVLEAILAGGFEAGIMVAVTGILRAAIIGALVGFASAAVIMLALRYYLVPDFLQNPMTLALVVFTLALPNLFQAESGLLAVTVMGATLASQKTVTVRHIVEFKENLRVLLIAVLFVILAARLPLMDPDYLSPGSLLFVAALVLLVRPLAVAASTWGSNLNWRERLFLSCMAPRGIVAAAVASLFALRLAEGSSLAAHRIVPLTFLVIAGTVTIYGLAAPIVARRLGMATPNPQGVLLVGAASWIRDIARVIHDQGLRVVMVDSNWANVRDARIAGLEAHYLDILDERAVESLDLHGIGQLVALTSNDEVNALSALHFGELFGRSSVYQLPAGDKANGQGGEGIPEHLRGRWLFNADATYETLSRRAHRGATVEQVKISAEFSFADFKERYGETALPLFVRRGQGDLVVVTAMDPAAAKPDDTVIALVDRPS